MRRIIIAAAALIGLAAPAIAQHFNIPAGDESFSQSAAARADRSSNGFVALAPLSAQPVVKAPRRAHHVR